MKTGSSSLNPYAADYVPLSKTMAVNTLNIEFRPGQESNTGFGHQGPYQSSSIQAGEVFKRKDQDQHGGGQFFASTSRYPNTVQLNIDEEFDMDLAYLQMTFPGISEGCLSGVYLASKCDLDAAVDMLDQLGISDDDLSDKLPDTLDIGDLSESLAVADPLSQKVKNPTAETGASASGSTDIPYSS